MEEVILSGYTPYPAGKDDTRLPHIAAVNHRRIHTAALGAENLVKWRHAPNWQDLINKVKGEGFLLVALEQSPGSVNLPDYRCPPNIALMVGREVEGLENEVLQDADSIVSIPMLGTKESFNVAQAAAMALYQFRYGSKI